MSDNFAIFFRLGEKIASYDGYRKAKLILYKS